MTCLYYNGWERKKANVRDLSSRFLLLLKVFRYPFDPNFSFCRSDEIARPFFLQGFRRQAEKAEELYFTYLFNVTSADREAFGKRWDGNIN